MKLTFAERKFQRSNKKVASQVKYEREVVMHGAMRRRCNLVCENGRVYLWCAHTDKLLCNLSEQGYKLLLDNEYFTE